MAKSNPLFVDSTKFHGDLIVCQIELKNALIYEGEMLSVVVTNQEGVVRKIEMNVLDEKSYEGRVHLNHQTSFTYQFVIEKGETRLFQSMIHKGRARYNVVELWQPVLEDPAQYMTVSSTMEVAVAPTMSDADTLAWARESSLNVRSLIDKWGL